MPEVVYNASTSLDGYIATKDGGVEWLDAFRGSGRRGGGDGFAELYASFDGLLLGSRTYDLALKLGYWPAPDKPSWVFTRRDLPVLHRSITLTPEDPSELVPALGDRGLKRLWLMGGGQLATSFRERDLITGYIIRVVPILLGEGIPLFAATSTQTPKRDLLQLVEAKSDPGAGGALQLIYRVKPGA
jgi:dihydrofolate reductase